MENFAGCEELKVKTLKESGLFETEIISELELVWLDYRKFKLDQMEKYAK